MGELKVAHGASVPVGRRQLGKAYFWSLADSVLLSAFNFVLAIVLVRYWEPEFYGAFVFWRTIVLFVGVLQQSTVTMPMSVFLPAAQSEAEKAAIIRTLSSCSFFLGIASIVVILAMTAFVTGAAGVGLNVALAIAAYASVRLVRGFGGALAFARIRPMSAIYSDVVFLVLVSGIFLIFAIEPDLLDLFLIFSVLAVAAFASAVVVIKLEGGWSIFTPLGFDWKVYRPIWKEGRWSLLGNLAGHGHHRGHVYVVSSLYGTGAVATLAAAEIAMRPFAVLVSAWIRVARPHLSSEVAAGNRSRFIAVLLGALALACMSMLGLAGFLYFLAWPYIEEFLYQGKYEDMANLAIIWWVIHLVMGFRTGLTVALQSLKKFSYPAISNVAGSIVSVAVIIVLSITVGYRASLYGFLVGELIMLGVCAYYFIRSMDTEWKPQANGEPKVVPPDQLP